MRLERAGGELTSAHQGQAHVFPPGDVKGKTRWTSDERSSTDEEEQEMLRALRVRALGPLCAGGAGADDRGEQAPITPSRYTYSRRVLLVVALLLLSLLFAFSAASLVPPTVPPLTRVGPRRTSGLYHGRGCNSTQLLASLERARIREDGASRTKFAKELSAELDLSDFEFSYDRSSILSFALSLR